MDKTWKKFERQVAKILKGRRVPVSEDLSRRLESGDVEVYGLYVSCRLRKRVAPVAWYREARPHARRAKKPAVVIFRVPRHREIYLLTELHNAPLVGAAMCWGGLEPWDPSRMPPTARKQPAIPSVPASSSAPAEP